MKCPICVKGGESSRLYLGPAHVLSAGPAEVAPVEATPALGAAPYFEPDGTLHLHDPARREMVAICSNGHELRLRSTSLCPAGDYPQGAAPGDYPALSELALGDLEWLYIERDPDQGTTRGYQVTDQGERVPVKKQ